MDIIIQNLRKNFGEKVAVNIDRFNIHSGEILGLVGNNGAGKSTLFRLILDLIKADEGTVHMADNTRNINVAETRTGQVLMLTIVSLLTTLRLTNTSSSLLASAVRSLMTCSSSWINSSTLWQTRL